MSKTTDKIVAVLTGKTTGLTSAEIREASGLKGPLVSASLFAMVKRGQLLKHKGETSRTARFSLNPEQLADPKPASRKKAAKKAAKKSRRAPPPAAAAGARAGRALVHPRHHRRPGAGAGRSWRYECRAHLLGRGHPGRRATHALQLHRVGAER